MYYTVGSRASELDQKAGVSTSGCVPSPCKDEQRRSSLATAELRLLLHKKKQIHILSIQRESTGGGKKNPPPTKEGRPPNTVGG